MSSELPKRETGRGAKLLRDRLRQRSGESTSSDPIVPVAARTGTVPLSFGQRRLWVLDQLRPGSTEYLMPMAFRLRGDISGLDLRGALTELIRRREILRTRYTVDDAGNPVQTIDPPYEVELTHTDLTGASDDELDALLHTDLSRPIDLATGPVLRARLIRLGEREHVLSLVLHHIAADGWSGSLLAGELAALCAGEDLPEPTLQYADFAIWQRAHASGEWWERGMDYWVRQLRDLPELELPTDRPRPAVWDPAGATVTFHIPTDLAAASARLAGEHRATVFMTYLAAFWALLHRYTGQTDFAVGSPVAGRTRAETHDVIGFFLNTLVLRADVTGDLSFRDLLQRARTTALDAYEHQDVPFERVVDAMGVARDLSTHPLVGVNFILQNNEPFRFEAGAVTGELVPVEQRQAQFDLTWTLEEQPDGSVLGHVTYAHALFDRDTAERMGTHYVHLLRAAVSRPDTRIGDLPLLDEAETRHLLRPALMVAESSPCLHDRFAEQARLRPDATALVFRGERLSYSELDTRANRLAHRLRSLGVGREDLVGICLHRGTDMIIAILAVLKAGAAYLPMDPAHPVERIGFMISDAAVKVLLTQRDLRELVSASEAPVIVLDDPEERGRTALFSERAPTVASHPDDLAYVIYTSGSTGRPKGVQVSHANVVRLLTANEEEYRFGPLDVWPLFHSYAFDVSVWEIWGAFLYGGRLVVVPHDVTRSPWDFARLLADEGVTVLNQTPSAFGNLIELVRRDDPVLDRLSLRLVIFAGEKLDVGQLKPWWDRFGDRKPLLVNKYGITEITVHATYRALGIEDLEGERSPIGRPIRDLTLYVLDDRLRPVPVGVPGEIYVGGPGVTRGYLNRPALTAQRFVPDPYGPPGSRLYRSGDKAKVLANGDIAFLGRFDNQVKIRGFRVELGEVEACLADHPDLKAAVVTVHRSDAGTNELVAYVVPKDGVTVSAPEIRAALAERLPAYMVPGIVMTVPKFPLTANGKLDMAALPRPDRSAQDPNEAFVAPRNETERALAEIWAEVLGVRRVGIHDNFFAFGGDSIHAVRLVGRMRSRGFDYAVQDLFRHQSIAELVGSGAGSGADEGGIAPFALISEEQRAELPDTVVDAYPMSRVQAGMVYEMLADSDRSNYHNVTSYLIRDDGEFDPEALHGAVRQVVANHEVLRTSFDLATSLQWVHAAAEPEFGHEDLRSLSEAEQRARMDEFRGRERARLFDLSKAPLIRVHAHRVADDRFFLTLTEHHAVLDGWSHNSVISELVAGYRALRDGGEPPAAPATAVRFADFIDQELKSLAGTADRQFWAEQLKDSTKLVIPPSWADPDGPGDYHLRVPYGHLRDRLQDLALAAGASLKSVLLAAHLAVCRTFAEGDGFHSGLLCNGRTEAEGGDQVRGMFLNPVPFVAPSGARTWRELVQAVFAQEVALWPHRRYPMPQLQVEFGKGDRLIEVAFNYLDFHVLDRTAVDTSASIDIALNEFPLCVLTEDGDLVLIAKSEWIGEKYTALLARMFERVLELMATNPDGSTAVSLLPEDERSRLLTEGNDNWEDPPDLTVPEHIVRHAAHSPDAVAVESGAERLTYRQLWRRANAFGERLHAAGVRRGQLVGLCLPQRTDLVAAALGVVNLGAAYVPVDPDHPDERVTSILRDAGVRVVVADRDFPDPLVTIRPSSVPESGGEAGETELPPACSPHPEDLVYVVHTSGSSGRPKGVMVRHLALAERVRSMTRDMDLGPDDVVVSVVPTVTDVWQMDMFVALAAGSRLVLAGIDYARDPVSLAALLRSSGATLMQASPTTWRMLDESGWVAPPGFHRVSGGEALGAELVDRFGNTETGVWDMYGPAEVTMFCFGSRYTASSGAQWVPATNTVAYVLDDDLEPVPVGVPGQIFVGGTGLARGYLGRPAATAAAFLPDHLTGVPGGRMYATGDIGRRLPDGRIEVLGRRDHQVKIRGFRVELGEVEAALVAHPGVRAAVVHPVTDSEGVKRLAAYLIPNGDPVPPAELAAFLTRTLPGYMVPTYFLSLDAFPRLANGKVNRDALPVPDGGRPDAVSPYRPPEGELEERIAEVWAEVLGLERVGRDDDFYALGGHSLLTMRIIARLSRQYGITLGFRDFLRHRTVRGLAEAVAVPDPRSSLLWLGNTGTATPLFCVHPGGGSAHWYRELAEVYTARRPLAAFEWSGTNGEEAAPSSLADVAARYVAELKEVRPAGPCPILGWCGSSGIAWEMARRLHAEGREPQLILIDPIEYPSTRVNPLAENVALLRRAESLLDVVREEEPEGARRDSVRAELIQLLSVITDDGTTVFDPDELDLDLVHGWADRLRSWREMAELRLRYRFPKYAGSVHILVCEELLRGGYEDIVGQSFDSYLDHWRGLAGGGVRVRSIPGNHRTALLPPHVSTLADTVAAIIDGSDTVEG